MKRTCHTKGFASPQFSNGTDFTLPVSTVSRNDTLLSTYHYLADGTKYKVIDPCALPVLGVTSKWEWVHN
jgi:hypothetical protein